MVSLVGDGNGSLWKRRRREQRESGNGTDLETLAGMLIGSKGGTKARSFDPQGASEVLGSFAMKRSNCERGSKLIIFAG